MKTKFFICGYYGWNNTGDDVMLYILLHEINKVYHNSEFVVLSRIPVLIPRHVNDLVKFISDKKLLRVLIELVRCSVFVLGGGTHLYDYGNKKNRIVRLSQMLVMLTICKVLRKEIYFINIGIETPSTIWGKFLIRLICHLPDCITTRDSISYDNLKMLRSNSKIFASFDLALLLGSTSNRTHSDEKILGVSILPFFEIYYDKKEKDLLLVHKIADGLSQWLKDPQNLIYLFVIKGKSKDDDVSITDELLRLLEHERVRLIPYNRNPIETLTKVAECDAFLGMRYHSCVFAYLSNIPLLIIDYAQKNRSLAKDIGLNDNAIISLDAILRGELGNYIKNLKSRPEEFVATLPVSIAVQNVRLW